MGDELIGRRVAFKWPVIGWHFGQVIARNWDKRRKIEGKVVNFVVRYDDETEGPHCLSLETLISTGDAEDIRVCEDQSWVLLDQQ